MNRAALRRFLHAGTSSILLIGLLADWQTFRLAVHVLLGVAVVGEGLRLGHAGFRSALARAFPVFRPEESVRLSGAFWLVVGYTVASWVPFPGPPAGVLAAAFADPAASIVGTRWGGGGGTEAGRKRAAEQRFRAYQRSWKQSRVGSPFWWTAGSAAVTTC